MKICILIDPNRPTVTLQQRELEKKMPTIALRFLLRIHAQLIYQAIETTKTLKEDDGIHDLLR